MTLPFRAVSRAAAALCAGSLLVCGPLGSAAPSALAAPRADPLGDAQRQAAALRTKVDALQQQAELAIEAYDAEYAKLGVAVTDHLRAERALEDAQQASGASSDIAGRRIRALYMSGGTAGLYAQVLDSASITDVAQRVDQVRVVLAEDSRATHAADQTVTSAQSAEQRASRTATVSTELQKAVTAKADAVESLLAQADALLSQADQQVRTLMDQQEAAAEQASSAAAQAAIAAARAQLGNLPEVTSPTARIVLAFAQAQIGKPYLWGGTGPNAWDCSGLTEAAYATAGITLPRTAAEQFGAGQQVGLGALEPGDLLFWAYDVNNVATIHHVAIYAGNGLMIAAPHTGDVVKVEPVYLDGYVGAIRPY